MYQVRKNKKLVLVVEEMVIEEDDVWYEQVSGRTNYSDLKASQDQAVVLSSKRKARPTSKTEKSTYIPHLGLLPAQRHSPVRWRSRRGYGPDCDSSPGRVAKAPQFEHDGGRLGG